MNIVNEPVLLRYDLNIGLKGEQRTNFMTSCGSMILLENHDLDIVNYNLMETIDYPKAKLNQNIMFLTHAIHEKDQFT